MQVSDVRRPCMAMVNFSTVETPDDVKVVANSRLCFNPLASVLISCSIKLSSHGGYWIRYLKPLTHPMVVMKSYNLSLKDPLVCR